MSNPFQLPGGEAGSGGNITLPQPAQATTPPATPPAEPAANPAPAEPSFDANALMERLEQIQQKMDQMSQPPAAPQPATPPVQEASENWYEAQKRAERDAAAKQASQMAILGTATREQILNEWHQMRAQDGMSDDIFNALTSELNKINDVDSLKAILDTKQHITAAESMIFKEYKKTGKFSQSAPPPMTTPTGSSALNPGATDPNTQDRLNQAMRLIPPHKRNGEFAKKYMERVQKGEIKD